MFTSSNNTIMTDTGKLQEQKAIWLSVGVKKTPPNYEGANLDKFQFFLLLDNIFFLKHWNQYLAYPSTMKFEVEAFKFKMKVLKFFWKYTHTIKWKES